jgi:glycosyltransferase involved in cell wall biosynthesis
MKILLLSYYGYLGASSRYRCYQYLPYLKQKGFEITVAPLLKDDYIKSRYSGQRISILSLIQAYVQRISQLFQSNKYDLIWIQKELFSWLPNWFELMFLKSEVPYVFDYDDAVFHRYDQHHSSIVRRLLGDKIDKIMSRASLVIAGNDYLANRAEKAGAKWIEILPTVVDLERYPLSSAPNNDIFTIGWIGFPLKSYDYLKTIEPALRVICQKDKVRVIAIGAAAMELDGIPLEIRPWSQDTEVQEIQKFDVGIMPLTDTPLERGKCGFKLIQYMASARPVIGSPVGINSKIIVQGVNGFQASSIKEWIDAFDKLRNDSHLRKQMGQVGREMVENYYSLQVTAPKLADLFIKHLQ